MFARVFEQVQPNMIANLIANMIANLIANLATLERGVAMRLDAARLELGYD